MKLLKFLTILAVSILLVGLSGCSKSSSSEDLPPDDGYYITFKVDGSLKEYKGNYENGNLIGNFNAKNNEGYVSSWVIGLKNSSENDKNLISLTIGDVNDHQVNKTYTNKESSNKDYLFLVIYTDENGKKYSTVNNKILIPEGGVLDAELTFTEVNDKLEKGIFSGTFYNNEDDTPITLSEGKFYVPRLKNGD